jgi:hypothetical protein
VIGRPFRAKCLYQALRFLAAQPEPWLTTSDEIADHYLRRLDEREQTPDRGRQHRRSGHDEYSRLDR